MLNLNFLSIEQFGFLYNEPHRAVVKSLLSSPLLSSPLLSSPPELHVAGRQKKHGGPAGGLPVCSYSEDLQIPIASQSEVGLVHATHALWRCHTLAPPL